MDRLTGLETLFNLEKNNFRAKEDYVVAALHRLFVNQNLQCVGTGDDWPETAEQRTEMLPREWNSSGDVYSLRYISRDSKSRYLLKVVKADHLLHINAALNEDKTASMTVPTSDYVSDDYTEYSTAYRDLESLSENFQKEIFKQFEKPPAAPKPPKQSNSPTREFPPNPRPLRNPLETEAERNRFRIPEVGGSDLDPFGFGRGGMLVDPSSFGVPARPDFGFGSPGGLPRGSVPPGARFDPYAPPGAPHRYNPDNFKPPDYDFI